MKRIKFDKDIPRNFTEFLVNFFDLGINLSKMGFISLSILGFTYGVHWNFLSEKEKEKEDLIYEMVEQIRLHIPKED